MKSCVYFTRKWSTHCSSVGFGVCSIGIYPPPSKVLMVKLCTRWKPCWADQWGWTRNVQLWSTLCQRQMWTVYLGYRYVCYLICSHSNKVGTTTEQTNKKTRGEWAAITCLDLLGHVLSNLFQYLHSECSPCENTGFKGTKHSLTGKGHWLSFEINVAEVY